MSDIQHTPESLGTFLKRAREEKNVSVEQVAYATRISLKMLRALEEDDHTALPAPTFVRGYLQAYAKYVRLDTQDLLLRYQHHLATAPDTKKSPIRSHYLYVRERYQEKRKLVLVIILFVALLSVAGTYFLLKAKRERNKRLAQTAEQIASVEKAASKQDTETKAKEGVAPTETTDATESTATTSPTAKDQNSKVAAVAAVTKKPEPEASPAKQAAETKPQQPQEAVAPTATTTAAAESASNTEKKVYNLFLNATEDVWLRYQTDEEEVKDLTLRGGKALMLRANKVIKIFSGNLGALKAKMNGEDLASLMSKDRSKSVVLPSTEAPNYKLPLFPQFQTTRSQEKEDAKEENTATAPSPTTEEGATSQ